MWCVSMLVCDLKCISSCGSQTTSLKAAPTGSAHLSDICPFTELPSMGSLCVGTGAGSGVRLPGFVAHPPQVFLVTSDWSLVVASGVVMNDQYHQCLEKMSPRSGSHRSPLDPACFPGFVSSFQFCELIQLLLIQHSC